ncbi:uncharacterized protein LOC128739540 [Sabethes cyaneus]|uniref:uncharacterized protein LOC128739540 n=1 Tax=Sabethes cyaneus TaxID=53552 RepID=UPI00237E6736|nr:uncharacterized protein LOC128739540 [Sabethes cyaneus]
MSDLSSDPESNPSFQTESESEYDSTWGEDKEHKEVDYTATAKEIICEDVNITTENALKLNSGYHNMLKVLRNKLEILLAHCQERQAEIEKQIDDYRNNRKPVTGKSRTSGYICGQPFFKDEDLYPGPHNDDYLYRKNVRKEFFPLDLFEVTDTNWTVKDKVNILKGVKQQIIEFIDMENRLKIKKIGNGLEAERLRREIVSLKTTEITDLWEKVKNFPKEYPNQKFEIDWMRISNVNISMRHSVEACMGIWNNYMIPGLVRDTWKAEEETLLLEAVEQHQRQDWEGIAKCVPGRSPYQCFVHYQTTFSDLAQIKHEKWTEEEDALLVKLVDENRIGTNIVWNKVVEKMPLRNKIQCYNRYMFTLMRPTKNTKFTQEEDCIIIAYVQQYGDDFRFIQPNLLPGRTNRQIWARYNQTLKYVNKHSGWTIEDDMRLMNFIKENLTDEGPRKISWAACSKVLGNHSRLSCRTRYYTIEKFLEKFPDATLDDVPRKDKKLSSSVTNENWVKTIIDIRNDPGGGEASANQPQEQPSSSGSKEHNKSRNHSTSKKERHFSSTLKCAFKKHLYEKMKYSFHYSMNDQSHAVENQRVFSNNRAIFMLLNCSATADHVDNCSQCLSASEASMIRNSLAVELNQGLVNFLRSAMYCYLFPPNYNTLLGLRGVVLNATYPEEPLVKSAKEVACESNDNNTDYKYALETFKERFKMLFTWTMLLVTQNPREADFKTENSNISYSQIKRFEIVNEPLEKQASLEQLSKLYKSPRLPRSKRRTKKSVERSTVCLDQLSIDNRPFDVSAVPTSSQICQPLVQEELPDANASGSIVIHQSELTAQVLVTSAEVETAYPLQYAILVSQPSCYDSQQINCSITNVEPVSATLEEVTFTDCTSTHVNPVTESTEPSPPLSVAMPQTDHLDLVAQITVIDPDNLPPAAPPPSSSFGFGAAQQHNNLEGCEEKSPLSSQSIAEPTQQAEPLLDKSGGETCVAAEVDCFQENDHGQLSRQDQQSYSPQLIEEPEQDHDIDEDNVDTTVSETCSLASESCSGKIFETGIAYVTTDENIVIEELDIKNACSSPKPDFTENYSIQSTTLELDEPLDLHISKVTEACDINSSQITESQEQTVELGTDPSLSSASVVEAVDQNVNVEPALIEVPKKTYSRTSKVKLPAPAANSTERFWRWTHLSETDEEEIELHRELWEKSDPIRLRFQPTQCDEVTEHKSEIIVIDDDEIVIKEELPEVEADAEIENKVESVEAALTDEAYLQQIIERADNIARITEAYKRNEHNVEVANHPLNSSSLPDDCLNSNVMDHPSSLIVQTPSQIFDEENNCFYYVDEIEEDTAHDYNIPVVEIPQMSIAYPRDSTLEDIVRHSLQKTYSVIPEFQPPRPYSSPNRDIEDQLNKHFVPTVSMQTADKGSKLTVRNITGLLSKAQKAEQCILDVPSPSVPRIRAPKRPPRNEVKPTQPKDKKKALCLLNDLYKRPRLPPSKIPVSTTTNVNYREAASSSATVHQLPVLTRTESDSTPPTKRRPSPQRLSGEVSSKKTKTSSSFERTSSEIILEPQHDEILQLGGETCNAVDIIDALHNMRERMKHEVFEEDEFPLSDEEETQLARAASSSSSVASSSQLRSKPSTSTATHRKINTIIKNTSGRPAMDVFFKVGGLTIKKIPHHK